MQGTDPIEITLKRLVALGSLGGVISHANGHRYLYFYPVDEASCLYQQCLRKMIPPPRHKVYGSIVDALDSVDECLSKLGSESLLTTFSWLEDGSAINLLDRT